MTKNRPLYHFFIQTDKQTKTPVLVLPCTITFRSPPLGSQLGSRVC